MIPPKVPPGIHLAAVAVRAADGHGLDVEGVDPPRLLPEAPPERAGGRTQSGPPPPPPPLAPPAEAAESTERRRERSPSSDHGADSDEPTSLPSTHLEPPDRVAVRSLRSGGGGGGGGGGGAGSSWIPPSSSSIPPAAAPATASDQTRGGGRERGVASRRVSVFVCVCGVGAEM